MNGREREMLRVTHGQKKWQKKKNKGNYLRNKRFLGVKRERRERERERLAHLYMYTVSESLLFL